jgi:hypothetical protein
MFRSTERNIAHQPHTARDLQHVSPLHNRIRQPRISIMAADKVSEALPHDPAFHLRAWNVSP